jgi:hypothetical protein
MNELNSEITEDCGADEMMVTTDGNRKGTWQTIIQNKIDIPRQIKVKRRRDQ